MARALCAWMCDTTPGGGFATTSKPDAQRSQYTPSQPGPTWHRNSCVTHTAGPGPNEARQTSILAAIRLSVGSMSRSCWRPPTASNPKRLKHGTKPQQQATRGEDWWSIYRKARPVPWQQLLHVLTTLQQLATHTGQTLAESEAALPNRLREAGACQPPAP